ncbi:hypothetical protein AJ78_03625 [Emergomyces pasteurianus Ep9510]|uniref:Uncharacterized protein n=1 Tax=Emergomyces pasteurianus Ep9510 TaxID=1447872 RepID=A0A1J9PIB6_9EURO|nr:hypothetical protein AJ78_03625 [Emergomyces pasteurianus Ep9510]
MSSPSEPSILEYARFHNIATNSIPDLFSLIPSAFEDINVSLYDIPNRPSVDIEGVQHEIQAKTREKIDASWASAPLLSSVLKSSMDERPTGNYYDEGEYSSESIQIRGLKLETPILRTDHEMDMRFFRRRISLDCMEIDVPLEHLDDENDESLKFSSSFWSQQKRAWDMAQKERLSCMKEGLMLIQGIKIQNVQSGNLELDDWLDEGTIFRGKRKDIDPQTPILLPRDITPVPFVPSSPCLEMEILPEPETPPKAEQEIERRLLEDSLMPNCDQIVSDFVTVTNQAPTWEEESNEVLLGSSDLNISRVAKCKIEDLKVETPITPPVSTKKRPAENDEDILNAMARAGAAPEILSHDLTEIGPSNLIEELSKAISTAKRKADDELNGERIRGINPMTRCKVPSLIPPIVVPPWPAVDRLSNSELLQLYRAFISSIKRQDLASLQDTGSGDSKMDLKWQPFAMELWRLEVKETIYPEDALDGFLLGIGGRLGSSDNDLEPSKPIYYEFRISSLDDDEEILAGLDDEEVGLATPLRGERSGNCPVSNVTKGGGGSMCSHRDMQLQASDVIARNLMAVNVEMNPKAVGATSIGSTLSSSFSPFTSLSNFMGIRGRSTVSGSDRCPYFHHTTPPDPPGFAQHNRHTQTSQPLETPTAKTIPAPLLATPETSRPHSSLTFVLSASLLRTHRAIVHNLESLSPACNLIFRDFSTPLNQTATGTWAGCSPQRPLIPRTQHYPDRSQSNEGQEADISLSPSVGVLLTTTQEITQKYLPGHQPNGQGIAQELNSPARRRISNVCLLYELLYVLICNPILTPKESVSKILHADIDDRTAEVVDSLKIFCESLGHFSTISSFLVMNDVISISDWLVSLANKHYTATPWSTSYPVDEPGVPNSSIFFPEEPSPSELFLRQLGLNSFAAQMVLLHLYETSRDEVDGLHSSGNNRTQRTQNPQAALSRFIAMTSIERHRIFAPILGQRVLERVDRRLAVEKG